MHVEGHIESGSGYSSGGGTTPSGPRRTNRTPIGSAGTDMGSGMMGNPTMGSGVMMGMMASDGSTMTTMGVRSPDVNMDLPLASAIPINVDENIQNLQQIQSFPVAGTGPNGIHFHQDPVTGQMYRMTQEFHQRIPQILASRTPTYTDVVDSFFATDNVSTNGVRNGTYTNGTFVNDSMGIGSTNGTYANGTFVNDSMGIGSTNGTFTNGGIRNGNVSTVGTTDVVTSINLGTFIDQSDLLGISTAQNSSTGRTNTYGVNNSNTRYTNGTSNGMGTTANGMSTTFYNGDGQPVQDVAMNGLVVRGYEYRTEEASVVDAMGRYTPVNTYSSAEGGYSGGGTTLQKSIKQLNVYTGNPIGGIEGTEYFKYTPVNIYSGQPRPYRG